MNNKKYRYSEIFRSIQGEGEYTGRPTVWYRAWGCNFQCRGFSSNDPKNVNVDELPFMTLPLDDIKSVEELPVFEYGCDSSYSWAKRYAHLAHQDTVTGIANNLIDLLPSRSFLDKHSKQNWHIAFTGGEPMISQNAIVDIMEEFHLIADNNLSFSPPKYVTIETNGTQLARSGFIEYFKKFSKNGGELFWSCSPKLTPSGENWDEAIRPTILKLYNDISCKGQLKYVVDGTTEAWDEVEKATAQYRKVGIEWPVWIMPVGATKEEQENLAGQIADQALDRGYNVSARVHCYLWGNEIGR